MWSDNETEIDLLGFDYLADAVVSVVQRDDLLPATIGVYGDWGGGKSSLLRIVKNKLETDPDVVVLSFNGWLFEDYENAKTALMGSILEELQDNHKLIPEVKDKVKGLLKRVNGLKLATGIGKVAVGLSTGMLPMVASGGWDFLSIFASLKENAKGVDVAELKGIIDEKKKEEEDEEAKRRKQIREFRKDFQKLLQESNIKRLVVIIDDLDRCLPDTIIDTLEAIKLFLFVPSTAFILGADESLVKYAVRKRFPELPGERAEVGRDYLEKLVQFPLRVPPLGQAAMETYVGLLFVDLEADLNAEQKKESRDRALVADADNLSSVNFNLQVAEEIYGENLSEELKERLGLTRRIAPLLATGLKGNPRQCKRFLNTLLLRLSMAKSRNVTLEQRYLAKLMLLEYFRPESFRRLSELQSEQSGRPVELGAMEAIARGSASLLEPAEEVLKTRAREPNKKGEKSEAQAQVEKKLDGEFQLWLDQPWTGNWLKLDPPLKDVDLRPYFYFSRDVLVSAMGAEVSRMTPPAQDVVAKLLNESEAVRATGLTKLEGLSDGDISAIFESFINRAQQEQEIGKANAAFQRLIEIAGKRKEMRGELIIFLNRTPDSEIAPVVPIQLEQLYNDEEWDVALLELFQKWEKCTNKGLAGIVSKRLQIHAAKK
ncbi:MAG TPA: P-loop NTPase fold protein [Pyrinomonadaceae bacterium]|nr:P-loop NTPase fold protein [Pyrinomonadaceae bacterium]